MINRANPLPITQQCRILDVCRSSVYYKPVPLADRELELMRRIDEIHLKLPFYPTFRTLRTSFSGNFMKPCSSERELAQALDDILQFSVVLPPFAK